MMSINNASDLTPNSTLDPTASQSHTPTSNATDSLEDLTKSDQTTSQANETMASTVSEEKRPTSLLSSNATSVNHLQPHHVTALENCDDEL